MHACMCIHAAALRMLQAPIRQNVRRTALAICCLLASKHTPSIDCCLLPALSCIEAARVLACNRGLLEIAFRWRLPFVFMIYRTH